jgi:hypothetical protein
MYQGVDLKLRKRKNGDNYVAQYQTFLNFLNANSIEAPTSTQKQKQSLLCESVLNALSGNWNRVLAFRLYSGSNEDAALVDVRRLFIMSAINSPIYSESNGFTGNGTTAYIDTGFNLNALPTNSGGVIVARKAAGSYLMGPTTTLREIAAGARLLAYMSTPSTSTFITPANTNPRIWGAKRINSTQIQCYANNVSGPTTISSNGSAYSGTLSDLRSTQSGVSGFTSGDICVAIHLDTFSDTEFTLIQSAIQTYLS